MSNNEAPTREEIIKRLEDFTKAVTGDTREWHEFYLSVPAQPHRDSDFIFTEAGRLLQADAERIAELEAEKAALIKRRVELVAERDALRAKLTKANDFIADLTRAEHE